MVCISSLGIHCVYAHIKHTGPILKQHLMFEDFENDRPIDLVGFTELHREWLSLRQSYKHNF